MTYARVGKRLFDIMLTIPGLVLAAPIMALIGILVLIDLGSPVFYARQRPGYKGKPFMLYKFRTMSHAVDKNGELLPDEHRLTVLGRILRMLSLDELPELWNVVKGDMSLVGPRPLLTEYLEWYTPEQMRRHDVPPGITGCAQINGRNSLTWEEKLIFDVWYVKHCSWWLDIKILLLTVPKVLVREHVAYPEQRTLSDFLRTHVRLDAEKKQ